MNILYVSTSYPPAIGGAQIHLHYLAKAIKELGNDVNVLTNWSTNRNDYLLGTTVFADKELNYQYEGVQISQVGFSKLQKLSLLPWVLSYYFLMEPAIHKISSYYSPYFESLAHRPSLVHASRIGREFIIQAALDYCKKYDIPFILTPNHHERWQGYLYRQYDKIYRAADAIIVLTEAEKYILIEQKGVKEERIFQTGIGPVLSERYSEEEFREKYNVKGRYILFLGQHLKYKGFASLIKAAPMVWKRDRDVKFVFIGPQTSYSPAKYFAMLPIPG